MNLKIIPIFLLMSSFWALPLFGQKITAPDKNKPTLYYAEGQTYDRELGILILKGNVEFEHEGSVLEADYVTYNENTDIVTASGNVRLRQAGGDINFAEYVELTGDLKKGIILQLRTLMEDNSKIAAIEGRKFEDREELDQAVYTPCEFCGDKPPTWQINARRAVKNNVDKNIYFTDAEMRLMDIPVLYLPYVTQPLERRSGFLIPQPQYNTTLGASLEVPYYLVLSESADMTFSPVFYTEKNPLFAGEFRKAFGNGIFTTEGAITNYKKSTKDKKEEKEHNFKIPERRGYILANGKFNLNETWRARFSGGSVSDKTFFRRFGYSGWKNEPSLTSKGILEGFLTQRDYAAAKVYHFQGLRNTDVQRRISSPLPYLEYNAYSGVDPWGGRFNFNGNLLNLYRKSGINMQRAIGEVGWQRPWVAPLGQIFTVFASTRGDLYSVEHSRFNRDLRERGKESRIGRSKGEA
ncbi:MAG TPA: LPS assembly protein LptD, partial [Alphaproteobacteria bacterium]|nr:LPS assembly protein LptD [Alphaproteobacteria bacterium]